MLFKSWENGVLQVDMGPKWDSTNEPRATKAWCRTFRATCWYPKGQLHAWAQQSNALV